jgi:hypothetical protein
MLKFSRSGFMEIRVWVTPALVGQKNLELSDLT